MSLTRIQPLLRPVIFEEFFFYGQLSLQRIVFSTTIEIGITDPSCFVLGSNIGSTIG